jgi:methylmalonyl-CoA mutase N-terminal domain/subunit
MVQAVKQNYPQREIADASYELQCEVDAGRRIIVGQNDYTDGNDDDDTHVLRIDPALEKKQIGRLAAVRARRDGAGVERTLSDLKAAAATDANLMPALMDCAAAHVSEGEIVHALQEVWGDYREAPVF